MEALFEKVLTHLQAQNAFRDYGPKEGGRLPEGTGDVRRALYEGDFTTSMDIPVLFQRGIDVPQEAINVARFSVARALEKTMPDWAVRDWLENFFQRAAMDQVAEDIATLFRNNLEFVPAAGASPRRFFDFRIAPVQKKDFELSKTHAIDPVGGVFSAHEAFYAAELLEEQPQLVAGVLLWQFALRSYAKELGDYAKTKQDLSEPFKTRLIEFCRFLSQSAFLLASFAALLPMAIAAYGRGKDHSLSPQSCPMHVIPALEEFAARGGFMTHHRVRKASSWLQNILRGFLKSKRRVVICSAREALLRWVALPLSKQSYGLLSEAIIKAENSMKQSKAWRQLGEDIRTAIQKNNLRSPAHLRDNYKKAGAAREQP